MKIAPIIHAIQAAQKQGSNLSFRLVHTGQHYDKKMSGDFFEQLEIPEPDANLESGSGTQAEQTAKIMVRYERLLLEKPCDITLVVGDVTSTMACSIAAKKLGIKVAHVEAGIRSFDLSMPEEINRMVTDSITDYFFTTTELADANLLKAGIKQDQLYRVGNTMIDTLLKNRPKFVKLAIWEKYGLVEKQYIVMTMHRPANVDAEEKLRAYMNKMLDSTGDIPIVFPVHPRTAQVFQKLGIGDDRLLLTEPLPYLEFNYLVERSMAVVTDSGGITEETTVMGVPCMTLRDNTERPETCTIGTNELLGTNPDAIEPAMSKLRAGAWKKGAIPDLWDGHAAARIIKIMGSL